MYVPKSNVINNSYPSKEKNKVTKVIQIFKNNCNLYLYYLALQII